MSISTNFHDPTNVSFQLFDEGHNAGEYAWVSLKVESGEGKANVAINLFIKDRDFLAALVSAAIKAYDALADAQEGITSDLVLVDPNQESLDSLLA